MSNGTVGGNAREAARKGSGPVAVDPFASRTPLWRRLLRQREVPLLAVIVAFGAVMTFVSDSFLTVSNLTAVGVAMASLLIIAIANTGLMVSGGFDLSVGSVFALSGVIAGLLLTQQGAPVVIAVLVALLVGAVVGGVNGFIVTRVGVNPLVTTFGMLSVASSIALVISGSNPLSGFPSSFTYVGQQRLGQLPLAVLLVLILVVVSEVLLRKTRAARQLFYVGSNPEAAVLSGISVANVRFFAFLATGVAAALAGLLNASRLDAAYPLAGQGIELQVIAACVIGGCSLSGGEGSVVGSFLGVVLLALVNNALVLLNVDIAWQGGVIGAVLIVAVALDQLSKKRRQARGAGGEAHGGGGSLRERLWGKGRT